MFANVFICREQAKVEENKIAARPDGFLSAEKQESHNFSTVKVFWGKKFPNFLSIESYKFFRFVRFKLSLFWFLLQKIVWKLKVNRLESHCSITKAKVFLLFLKFSFISLIILLSSSTDILETWFPGRMFMKKLNWKI